MNNVIKPRKFSCKKIGSDTGHREAVDKVKLKRRLVYGDTACLEQRDNRGWVSGAGFIPWRGWDELIYDSVRKYASTMAHKVAAK